MAMGHHRDRIYFDASTFAFCMRHLFSFSIIIIIIIIIYIIYVFYPQHARHLTHFLAYTFVTYIVDGLLYYITQRTRVAIQMNVEELLKEASRFHASIKRSEDEELRRQQLRQQEESDARDELASLLLISPS